jgi:hypothetical protein
MGIRTAVLGLHHYNANILPREANSLGIDDNWNSRDFRLRKARVIRRPTVAALFAGWSRCPGRELPSRSDLRRDLCIERMSPLIPKERQRRHPLRDGQGSPRAFLPPLLVCGPTRVWHRSHYTQREILEAKNSSRNGPYSASLEITADPTVGSGGERYNQGHRLSPVWTIKKSGSGFPPSRK